VQLGRRSHDEAADAFAEAIKLSPRLGAASLELAKLRLRMGQAKEAVQRAADATRDLPASVEARYVLVRALMQADQPDRAALELQPLAEQAGNLPRVQTLTGLLALQRGDQPAAWNAFEKALALDAAENEAIAALVGLDLEAGRKADARRRVEARVAAAPGDVAAVAMAGRLYDTLGLARPAEEAWKKAIELDPSNLTAYEGLARLYLSGRRSGEALAECDRILRRQPRSVSAQTLAGVILQGQGRAAEAQQRYLKALEIDPRSATAANNLAWLYLEGGGNKETALQLARTAKSVLPDSPEVNDTLGWACYRQGLFDAAVTPLEQAVRLAPARATYRYHLGMAYLKTNDWARARASLEKALALERDFPGVGDARAALASIR
jgi:tetratricopeptide (TPR) repeat protein